MHLDELKNRFRRGERFHFTYFWGHGAGDEGHVTASCLSQWFPAAFVVEGVRYHTAEHWMMAEKARLFGDTELLEQILVAASPGAAKKLGGMVRNFEQSLWDSNRTAIVVAGNVHKFRQSPALGDFLRSTGTRVLVEASPLDRIWGIGLSAEAPEAQDPLRWRGLNLLGFALMEAREQL